MNARGWRAAPCAPQNRFNDERIARGPVVTVAGDQTNADRVSAGHQPIAVVLDLVNPTGPRRRSLGGGGRQGSMKPGGD